MRSVKMAQIEENIKTKGKQVNAQLYSRRANKPRIKRKRPRSIDERIALTKITRATVERAKREGKMKMTGKRMMYYDPSE